jgi:hypothetical protein
MASVARRDNRLLGAAAGLSVAAYLLGIAALVRRAAS